MDTKIQFSEDFKDFLKLLISKKVEYLLIGGYAVTFHGYPRNTGDIDIWVNRSQDNCKKVIAAIKEFGFDVPNLHEDLLLASDKIVRMGEPPFRIEIFTTIPGIEFSSSYNNKVIGNISGLELDFISLADLRKNKKASGRHKDLDDLENLPE